MMKPPAMSHTTRESPLVVSASTREFNAGDKFEYWRALSRNAGVEVDCELVTADPFDASCVGVIRDDTSVFRVRTSACRFLRNPDRVASTSLDDLVFYFVNTGRLLVEQDGRTVSIEGGSGVACAANRPFVVQCDAPQEIVAIRLPRVLLPRRSDLFRFTGCSLDRCGGAGAMVSGFAQTLAREAPSMDNCTLGRMIASFADLLSGSTAASAI